MKKNALQMFLGMILLSSVSFAAVPEQMPESFDAQYKIASTTTLPMAARWKALLSAAELANATQIQKVLAFSKDKEWYMRNATLVALDKIESDLVYDKARELINDKALVVRSAAVDVLGRLKDPSIRRVLSKEMMQKYNFNGKTSLWIRPQIMKYLVQNPTEEDKAYFAQFLYDSDKAVTAYSIQALEKLTQVRFSGKNSAEVIDQWRQFARKNKW